MPILQIGNGSMAIKQYTYIHTGSLWQSGTKQRYPESHKVIPPLMTRDGKQQSWRSLETASCYSIIWRGQVIQKHNWGFFFFCLHLYYWPALSNRRESNLICSHVIAKSLWNRSLRTSPLFTSLSVEGNTAERLWKKTQHNLSSLPTCIKNTLPLKQPASWELNKTRENRKARENLVRSLERCTEYCKGHIVVWMIWQCHLTQWRATWKDW